MKQLFRNRILKKMAKSEDKGGNKTGRLYIQNPQKQHLEYIGVLVVDKFFLRSYEAKIFEDISQCRSLKRHKFMSLQLYAVFDLQSV